MRMSFDDDADDKDGDDTDSDGDGVVKSGMGNVSNSKVRSGMGDYNSKMAAMKSMMDYADEMDETNVKPKAPEEGIGSEKSMAGMDPNHSSQDEGGGGGGGGMGGIMSLFSKFMGKK